MNGYTGRIKQGYSASSFLSCQNDTWFLFLCRRVFFLLLAVPSSDELKRLIRLHGGGFQHYYSKSAVTHIVATNLPDSKIKTIK